MVTLILRGLVSWTELGVAALQTGGCPRKTRQGWQGGNRQNGGRGPPTGFRVLQSPRGRRKAHFKPVVKLEAERVEKPKPEDPQVSGEPGLEVTGSPRASQGREQGWQEGWHCLGCGAAAPPPEPSAPEQKPDPQTEPTVTFLFTLLSTAEPTESKDPEE